MNFDGKNGNKAICKTRKKLSTTKRFIKNNDHHSEKQHCNQKKHTLIIFFHAPTPPGFGKTHKVLKVLRHNKIFPQPHKTHRCRFIIRRGFSWQCSVRGIAEHVFRGISVQHQQVVKAEKAPAFRRVGRCQSKLLWSQLKVENSTSAMQRQSRLVVLESRVGLCLETPQILDSLSDPNPCLPTTVL